MIFLNYGYGICKPIHGYFYKNVQKCMYQTLTNGHNELEQCWLIIWYTTKQT